MNGEEAISSDEEAQGGVDAKKGMEYLKREQSKEVAKLRRMALIKGMQAGTSGIAQDVIYTILDMVSQLLVVGQLYINLKSIFGGEGCIEGHATALEKAWFYVQLVLNALVTIFQFGLWAWGFCVGGIYCISYMRCPTSKDASCTNPMIAYRELLAKMDGVDMDEMDDDEKQEALSAYPPDEELKYDEDFKAFKKELATLGRINSLQNSLTNMRAGIGALGAMVEPALAAQSSFASMNKGDVAKATEKAIGAGIDKTKADAAEKWAAAAKKAAAQKEAIMKCTASRNVSATASGTIAAIGIKQAAMKSSYQKLVILAQMREKDVEQFEKHKAEGGNAKRRVTDEAIETELQDLLGPQGKKYLSYLSGQEAPE